MPSRRLLALAGLLVGAVPARADLVYVLNSGEASISVIEAGERREVRRIPTLREVHHLVRSPDGASVVVGDSGANELLHLDPDIASVRAREPLSNPYHLEYAPGGGHLVVTSLRRGQIDLYDGAHALVARLKVPLKPSHLAFSPDGARVFVTLQGGRAVMAIDLATRRPVWTAEVGPEPAGIVWHRGRLLVGVMGADYVAVVDPAGGRVERRVPVGRGAHTLALSPGGDALYATSRVDSRITVLDPDTLAVRQAWEIPGGPDCLAFAPDGTLWATLRWVGKVAAIDPTDGRFTTVAVGRSPHGILVQPRAAPLPPDGTAPAPSPVATPAAPRWRGAAHAAPRPAPPLVPAPTTP